MAWPATAVVTQDPVTAIQLNGLPILIANTTLSSTTANIVFSSIPQQFSHLWVVTYGRGDLAGNFVSGYGVQLNGDTAANYDGQTLQGSGATKTAFETLGSTSMYTGDITQALAAANLFGISQFLISEYASTTKEKILVCQSASKYGTATGNLRSSIMSTAWRSTAAVTSILINTPGNNLLAGTRASLYGIP